MIGIRSNASRGKRAVVWIVLITLFGLPKLWVNLENYQIYDDAVHNHFGSRNLDYLWILGLLNIAGIIIYVLAIVFFLSWFRRAYYNLHQFAPKLTYTDGWAAGSWFVPLFNFIGPIQIAVELFRESTKVLLANGKRVDRSTNRLILTLWWTSWVLGTALNIVASIQLRANTNYEENRSGAFYAILGSIVLIGSGIFCVMMIRRYMAIEKQLGELEMVSIDKNGAATDLLDTPV